MSTAKLGTHRGSKDDYMTLIDEHPLCTIRNDRELSRAREVLDSLLARDKLSGWEEAYVDALAVFIEKYEAEHHAIEPPADCELLRELIAAKGVSQVEVARNTGMVESTISAVLAGTRTLNRDHIGRLSKYFGVSPAVFSFDG